MKYKISEVNLRIKDDPAGFVKESEEGYKIQIDAAADGIQKNMSVSPIVLLSGPSGSGKTTTAFKLKEELERRGVVCHTISLDDYFITVNQRNAPRTPEGDLDFESPRCVDMELLNEHFDALNRGEEILIPHFMFARQKRSASVFRKLNLKEREIAIFEGIHALNDEIAAPHPEAMKLYISAATDYVSDDGNDCFTGTWLRLMRRVVRDNNFRGADAAYTIHLWSSVLRGETLYIDPYKGRANVTIDSTLPYEVSVLKQFAMPLFQDLSPDNPRRDELQKIIPALHSFADLSSDYVPEDSIIREFIGDSIYYNK